MDRENLVSYSKAVKHYYELLSNSAGPVDPGRTLIFERTAQVGPMYMAKEATLASYMVTSITRVPCPFEFLGALGIEFLSLAELYAIDAKGNPSTMLTVVTENEKDSHDQLDDAEFGKDSTHVSAYLSFNRLGTPFEEPKASALALFQRKPKKTLVIDEPILYLYEGRECVVKLNDIIELIVEPALAAKKMDRHVLRVYCRNGDEYYLLAVNK